MKKKTRLLSVLITMTVCLLFSSSTLLAEDNIAPIAQNDAANVDQGSSVLVEVLANDSDANRNNLSIATVSTAANGSVVIEKSYYDPKVVTVDSTPHPIPAGLKTVGTQPILKWNGITCWAYSYMDNRGAFNIVAYDSEGNIIQQWAKNGDRYLKQIYVDTSAKKVYFRGQSWAGGYSQGVVMTFDELFVTVEKIRYTPNPSYSGTDNFTYVVSDGNGGTATATVNITVIDKTPPVITIAPYNTNLTNQDVIVTATTNEGTLNATSHNFTENGSFIFTATDTAGNISNKTVTVNNIDKTSPIINSVTDQNANQNGWFNQDVTIHFIANDYESGLASVTTDVTVTTEGAGQVIIGTATDLAGNTATVKLTINLDKTPPTITGNKPAANTNGWYNSDVKVTFEAEDAVSGIDAVTPGTVLSCEGTEQSVTGTAVDMAGNTAIFVVDGINIDKTMPTVAINSPDSASYFTNDSFTVDYTSEDSLSGIATETVTLDGSMVTNGQLISLAAMAGNHTLTVTVKDVADNENTASATFTVIIAAVVDIKPDTLNLKSGGENSITGYIEFPSGYDVNLVDVASVKITVNGIAINAQANPTSFGDYDSDSVRDVIVKFDRQQLIEVIGVAGDVTIKLSGSLTDGRTFEGNDVVKVIKPGNGKK